MKIKIHIPLLFSILFLLGGCNIYKVVPPGKYLLRKNKLEYKVKDTIKPQEASVYILQQPNFYVLGYPFLVGIYSIADPHPQLSFNKAVMEHPHTFRVMEKIFSKKQVYFQLKRYYVNINRQIQNFGEKPVIIDEKLTEKSRQNLHLLFKNYGFLDNVTRYKIIPKTDIKAIVNYHIKENDRYVIDTVHWQIESAYARRLFNLIRSRLQTKPDKFYNRIYLVNDREFVTQFFRNNGLFDFQSSYINYDIIKHFEEKKLDVNGFIYNKIFQIADSIYEEPFLPYHYKNIEVYVVNKRKFDKLIAKRIYIRDSIGFYYEGNRFFKPKYLKEAIFLKPGQLYSDKNVNLTRKQLYFLENFRQVYISHEKVNDTVLNGKIVLLPLKKYGVKTSFNVTNSSIRPLGLSMEGAITWRNIFRGFENLEISGMIHQAASKRFASGGSDRFLNVREISLDISLKIPRFTMPFLRRFIPLYMHPKTIYSLRFTSQTNIGLDRERLYAINSFEWKPSKAVRNIFTPMEVNYVHYKNPERYFEIYTTAFNTLNDLSVEHYGTYLTPSNAENFIHYVLSNESPDSEIYRTVKKIYERKVRLTENVFIINTNHTITFDTRKDIWDNDFYLHRVYAEVAGWLPGMLSQIMKMPENDIGQKLINKVPYAQYWKLEYTFIRHWHFGKKRILAYRFFSGLAVPFGNSTNVPFVSAYFAGGSNDIRAWRAFELGPGSSGGLGEFNEANFKLLTNLEYRMPFYDNHHLGFFVDAGNIWNLFDDIPYREAKFKGLYSLLHETAIGAGLGYRYDFSFFAIRIDWAYKIFDPARPEGHRWITRYKLRDGILQFGINYPF